ncbi:hypothetical protein Glittering_75 [Bacillus phage Glittering]|uniref:Uncharacterized protein n=2 Tax=Andromedavirus TaxID=1623275 RepID=M1IE93_9CAUD|nr:hypothetical protein I906_gp74 [Bacillus phage Curly]YP_008770711.1 hypothetical protein Glittering_75 [Bacillus phage Glittering]AGE60761.1 hypothetical protein CURLY_74 [Bacillus phage Curly]AGY47262.1 hypothetical protein Glittering_75 [Bacillus phage Glittering]
MSILKEFCERVQALEEEYGVYLDIDPDQLIILAVNQDDGKERWIHSEEEDDNE